MIDSFFTIPLFFAVLVKYCLKTTNQDTPCRVNSLSKKMAENPRMKMS